MAQFALTTPVLPDLAKTSPHVLHPERFALHLGTHLVSKYAHLKKAFITIEQLRWQRIPIAQGEGQTPKPHSHAFYRDGDDTRVVEAEVRPNALLDLQHQYADAKATYRSMRPRARTRLSRM